MTDKKIDIEKIKAEIEALELETDGSKAAIVIDENTKLSILWARASRYISLLQLSGIVREGSKGDRYLNALSAAMKVLIAKEEPDAEE